MIMMQILVCQLVLLSEKVRLGFDTGFRDHLGKAITTFILIFILKPFQS